MTMPWCVQEYSDGDSDGEGAKACAGCSFSVLFGLSAPGFSMKPGVPETYC